MASNSNNNTSYVLGVPWLVIFVILKMGSAHLIHWSWWWLLMPVVPDLVVILRQFGIL